MPFHATLITEAAAWCVCLERRGGMGVKKWVRVKKCEHSAHSPKAYQA